jgi:hypothetical protein
MLAIARRTFVDPRPVREVLDVACIATSDETRRDEWAVALATVVLVDAVGEL